jgi:transposase
MNPDSNYNPVAVDVSKKTLQVQIDDRQFVVANDDKGHASLLKHLKKINNPIVVFEASGGYEKPLKRFLHQSNITVCLVNPRRVRAFAVSEGIKAKTDPIDTMVLMRFAQEKKLTPTKAPTQQQEELAALLDRRSQLSDHLAMEKSRLDKSHAIILPSIKELIDSLEQQINKMENAIRSLIKKQELELAFSKAMKNIDGVGEITAWTILAYMPEITTLCRNEAVAMAGLAPFNRDSGKTVKPRRICGGRAKIRKCLFMAAQSAARFNPIVKQYVQKLRDRGKPYKCAMVAAMRKLLIHIRTILKITEKSLA